MEVWILLAAAGSGYLARCWQNSQKAKGVVAEEDNDTAGTSSQPTRPTRGKYRHFSNSGRHAGKLLCGKGNPQWIRQSPRSTQVPANTMVGTSSENKAEPKASNVEDRNMLQEGGKNHDSFSQFDTNKKSEDVTGAGILNKSFSENKCTLNENSVGSLHLSEDLSSGQTQGTINEGREPRGARGPLLSKSSSGKRTSDSSRGPGAIGGSSGQEAGSGKRMKDAIISPATTQDEAFVFGGAWMPGFWDVSEGVFVLDSDSLLVQQGEVGRSKDRSSRRIKTPRKHGRSRGSTFRRKNLVIQKPMSSLESCLSAQLDKEYSAAGSVSSFSSTTTDENKLLMEHLEKSAENQFGLLECRELNEAANYAIGLPPLSKRPTRRSKQRTLRHSSGRSSKSDIAHSSVAGSTEITWKGLLFNFGVGVGMMFTVLSNMREVKRLTMLLREAECLIKDLENELEGRETSKVCDFKVTPEKGGDVVERRQTAVVNTLYKVRSASQILNSMRVSLTDESLPIEHKQSKDMAKLEAELEAELERMELSLNVGNPSNHSGASEFETEVAGSLVQGELSVSGLPCETGLESEDDEGSDSLHDDSHVSNYAVSPRELSRRLHEVLEARQEERILELEAELQLMRETLEAKEEEIQLRGKKGFTHDERERCVEDAYTKAGRVSQDFSPCVGKDFPSRIQLHSKKLRSPFHDSPNPSPVSQGDVATEAMDGPFRMNKGSKIKDRTAFITLGGDALDAYNEACKEFSKVSCDATGLDVDTEKHNFPHKIFKDSMPNYVDQVNLAPDHHWEQVDLLSLAEDFCSGDGCEINEGMPRFSNISSKRRPVARRRNSRHKGNHPEPEQTCGSLKVVDSSDETANDTSGSTPCSIKFMDVRTVSCDHSENQSGAEVLNDAIPFPEWHQEVLLPAGANTPNQQERQFIYNEQEVLEALGGPGQHGSTSSPGEWRMAGDNDDSQDVDDQLGQLLIKRIVEKSRRGSPIIQDAQTVLASFEKINII